MLGPRVPGPRCPRIYQDTPGCHRPGGSVRSKSPRSKMSWDVPDLSLRVPGPRCPRIYQDIPGCPRPGGSVRSASPRSKMSQDVPDLEAVLGPRSESQVQDVLGYPGTSQDVPDLEAVLDPRVPGPRCPRISGDIPGCPRSGGKC